MVKPRAALLGQIVTGANRGKRRFGHHERERGSGEGGTGGPQASRRAHSTDGETGGDIFRGVSAKETCKDEIGLGSAFRNYGNASMTHTGRGFSLPCPRFVGSVGELQGTAQSSRSQ